MRIIYSLFQMWIVSVIRVATLIAANKFIRAFY